MLTRLLPGSVAVVAAFTMPEFSVGAGDLVERGGFDDPPEPAFRQSRAKGLVPTGIGQAPVKPQLAGVRYAAVLDLDLDEPASLALAPIMADLPVSNRPEPETGTFAAISAPVAEAVPPAFVPLPPAPAITPLEAEAGDRAELMVPASMPVSPAAAAAAVVAAVPVAAPLAVPAAMPPVEIAPLLPQAEIAGVAVPPVAVTPLAPSASPAAADMALVVAPLPAARQAIPAARIVAPQPPGPTAAATATLVSRPPVAIASAGPIMTTAAAVAPVMRTPVSATADVIKPVAATPVWPTASAPAPEPAKAAAIAVPRPATPALAAPPAGSKPAMPEIASRLITRVDGKTAGAVDFQQTAGGLKVRLGSVVEVLADRYDPAQLARIRNSEAGNRYLSLAELQAQGVPISYDPIYDEFNVGLTDTRPKAAGKVHIDQISTPYRGMDAIGTPQAPRQR
jgi:hypothetical protein